MPTWLKILLVGIAVIFVGPPALGFVLAALGIAIGVGALMIKAAIIGVGVYCIVLVLQALFGKPQSKLQKSIARVDSMDASRKALDEELERVLAEARKSTG